MGPHRLWSDSRASALKRRRVAAGLTLEEEARGVPCSTAQVHRAEQRGVGSPALWRRLAQILDCRVEEIRPPARGTAADGRQLEIAEVVGR